MRRLTVLLCSLVAAGLSSAAPIAFVNVNVVSMQDASARDAHTVIVDDGVIVALGPVDSIELPPGADVIDGSERYLMPGLAELHAHVPDASSPHLDRVLTLFAANGVTTIRGMLGRPSHLRLRDTLAGEAFGPRLVTSGPSLNGNSVSSPLAARQMVRNQHAASYDFIKIHPGLTVEEFLAAADTANELGMPFAGHVPADVGLDVALSAGMATIDHLDGYMAALVPEATGGGFFGVMLADRARADRIDELARRTAAAGVWNVPTEALFEHYVSVVDVDELTERAEMRYMPAATVRQWANAKHRQLAQPGFSAALADSAIDIRRRLIVALHEAGAGLLLGSDAPQVFNVPGYSLHQELGYLVAAGLTPYDAIHSGTVAAAEFLGLNTGVVAVGRDADLVLLDGNPLTDISNTRRIRGVMLRGRWYSQSELERRLDAFHSSAE